MVKPARLPSGREIPTWGVPVKVNEQLDERILGVPGVDQHRSEILEELERRPHRETPSPLVGD